MSTENLNFQTLVSSLHLPPVSFGQTYWHVFYATKDIRISEWIFKTTNDICSNFILFCILFISSKKCFKYFAVKLRPWFLICILRAVAPKFADLAKWVDTNSVNGFHTFYKVHKTFSHNCATTSEKKKIFHQKWLTKKKSKMPNLPWNFWPPIQAMLDYKNATSLNVCDLEPFEIRDVEIPSTNRQRLQMLRQTPWWSPIQSWFLWK